MIGRRKVRMAYGRIYIDKLRKKVAALFDELRAENHLYESAFIEAFKIKYPKDYAMLQYEWEFKVHEFKKNRKGQPRTHPIRPEKILSNMYRNYYFKLIKHPTIKQEKLKSINNMRQIAGRYGLKIKEDGNGKYNIINKETKELEHKHITYKKLKELCSVQNLKKRREEVKPNAGCGHK